jgi:hypothetical protein
MSGSEEEPNGPDSPSGLIIGIFRLRHHLAETIMELPTVDCELSEPPTVIFRR